MFVFWRAARLVQKARATSAKPPGQGQALLRCSDILRRLACVRSIDRFPVPARISVRVLVHWFLVAFFCSLPSVGMAEQAKAFNIPAEDITEALAEFSAISGQQFVFDPRDLAGRKSVKVTNEPNADRALTRLLDGSGLAVETITPRLKRIVVYRAAAESQDFRAAPISDSGDPPATVYVRGVRSALQTALRQQKSSKALRDIVVAEDITRLPDMNIAEALQRMSGVQISRYTGEGSEVLVRGLSQVGVQLNGRQVFSDTHRSLDLGALVTEAFSQISLKKTSSAEAIEGGIGGIIELRTWEPFDFKTNVANFTVRRHEYDLAGQSKIQMSGLWSSRFASDHGDFGVLIEAASNPSVARIDTIGIEPFTRRSDLLSPSSAGTVLAPHGAGNSAEVARRLRANLMAVAQWRGHNGLEAKLEMNHFSVSSHQFAQVLYANDGPMTASPTRAFTRDENGVVTSGAYADIILNVANNASDWAETFDQAAISGKWRFLTDSKLTFDLSQTSTERTNAYAGLGIGTPFSYQDNQLDFDLRSPIPSLTLTGRKLSDPTGYMVVQAASWRLRATGAMSAARVDADLGLDGTGLFKRVKVGARLTRQTAESASGGKSHLPGDIPVAVFSGVAEPVIATNFFAGRAGTQLFGAGALGAPASLIRDMASVCHALNDPVCQISNDPSQAYRALETTASFYVNADLGFRVWDVDVSGEIGARYIRTKLRVDGVLSDGTSLSPLESINHRTDLLPSANIYTNLSPDVRLRVAMSSQIMRPDFDSLSPDFHFSYTGLNGSPVGWSGNPNLAPLKADSLDVSVERYTGSTSHAYLTLFSKRITGFVQNTVQTEDVSFLHLILPTIPVARPRNTGTGHVLGAELGFQSLLPRLPGIGEGLGLAGNLTWTSSKAPGPIAGLSLPLLGMSPLSGTFQLYYEHAAFRARLAYTYRGEYLDTVTGVGSGFSPIYADAFGTLDASIAKDIGPRTEVRFEINNISRPTIRSHFGSASEPRFFNVYDRRIGIGLRVKL